MRGTVPTSSGATPEGGAGTCAFTPRGVLHAWTSTGAETGQVLFLRAGPTCKSPVVVLWTAFIAF